MEKKIIIAGGTGFIGKAISTHYLDKGYDVVVLTRGETDTSNGIIYRHWDGKSKGNWIKLLESSELLINLTGKSVDCRYTKKNKELILSSRIDSTQVLEEAIKELVKPPSLWINASTATIYKHSLNVPMTEKTGDIGNDFSMGVAKAWEKTFFKNDIPYVRKVALRMSLVLGKEEGVLPVLKQLTKFRLGGFHGNGKQKFAWLHIHDLIRIINWVEKNEIEGPINCTSNGELTNKQFMKALRN